MVAAADVPHGGGGAHGRHHFAFEIVLDEVSDPNPNPNPNPNPKPNPNPNPNHDPDPDPRPSPSPNRNQVSDLTCFTAQYLKGSRQAKPSFALRLEHVL